MPSFFDLFRKFNNTGKKQQKEGLEVEAKVVKPQDVSNKVIENVALPIMTEEKPVEVKRKEAEGVAKPKEIATSDKKQVPENVEESTKKEKEDELQDSTNQSQTSEKAEDTIKKVVLKKIPDRKIIRVSKMGIDHDFANKNNQDFAFQVPNIKVVMDGCGSGKHSEVGAKLFGQLFARKVKEYFDKGEAIGEENLLEIIGSVFEKMLGLCSDIPFIFQNYCFTILLCLELEDEFVVYSCGDGYIIKENSEAITFDKLDDGEYPCYYIYNYITDKSALIEYQDGVSFKVTRFRKEEYFNVGVASDGLRFWENMLDVEKTKLMQFLHEGKSPQIETLINRNNRRNRIFHDDISICF